MWGVILIILGLVSFFTGYFFLGKGTGQKDCKEKPESTDANWGGGIAGVVIGIIFILVGIIVRAMSNKRVEGSDSSN